MKILLTFDYELFFGKKSGTVECCMLRPTERILRVLEKADIKATFYVDIGYLLRCQYLGEDLDSYGRVVAQLTELSSAGHDIQLHIHPHWEDSQYRNNAWDFSGARYRLHQFSKSEVKDIISRYSLGISELAKRQPIAYRAGGWCIQPFGYIGDELYKAGIRIDSTVFAGGLNTSKDHGFDFRSAPSNLTKWQFDLEPDNSTCGGKYWELPIASTKVSPLFYWSFAFAKKLRGKDHQRLGDGSAVPMTKRQMARLLTQCSSSVVSMDGYKSNLLDKAYLEYKASFGDNCEMVIIGHPKSATPYSISKLDEFVCRHKERAQFVTTRDWYEHSLGVDL